MMKVGVITQNTFREVIRDRVLYGLLVFAVLFILFSLLLGNLSFAEQGRIVTNFGLAAAHFMSVVIAIFIGSTLVSREIERQTILTLLAKPISRRQFVVGKFMGLSLVLFLSIVIISMFLAALLYFYGSVHWGPYGLAFVGIFEESLILVGFALFFGSFARPVMTVVFTLGIWLIGHGVEDIRYFSSKSESAVIKEMGQFLAKVLPNFENFNWRNLVVYGDLLPSESILKAFLLCLGWSFLTVWLAGWIISKRDFI